MISASAPNELRSAGIPNNRYENRSWSSWIYLFFSSFFPTEEASNEHDAGRGWGGLRIDGPRGGRRRRPRCSRASVRTRRGPGPARPATADAIKEMMLALERGHQAHGGVPGGGSTDDAAGVGSEGQQGSGTHLAGQVAVAGDGASESGAFTSPRLPSTVHGGGRSSTRARSGTTRPGMSIRPCALSACKRRISKERRSSSARAIRPRP